MISDGGPYVSRRNMAVCVVPHMTYPHFWHLFGVLGLTFAPVKTVVVPHERHINHYLV